MSENWKSLVHVRERNQSRIFLIGNMIYCCFLIRAFYHGRNITLMKENDNEHIKKKRKWQWAHKKMIKKIRASTNVPKEKTFITIVFSQRFQVVGTSYHRLFCRNFWRKLLSFVFLKVFLLLLLKHNLYYCKIKLPTGSQTKTELQPCGKTIEAKHETDYFVEILNSFSSTS